MQHTQVQSLGQEDPLEKGMANHSSILENSMDRGAWQATVHGVAETQTQLIDLTQHFPQTTPQSSMVPVGVGAIYGRPNDGSASPEAGGRVLSSPSPPALSSDRGVSARLSPPATDQLLFLDQHLQRDTRDPVCRVDHPTHPLLVVWLPLWLACSRSNKLPADAVRLAEVRARRAELCSEGAERKAGNQGDSGNGVEDTESGSVQRHQMLKKVSEITLESSLV
ncbi:uncharacterized protein LOC122434225 [Cervus canadensis]|uniref:uncharacterized protein LOC122434225 n=1 Tax=Cervus canadensis TaxID=1574408 RepID=UPI001CA33CD5|nr:uncharacterized protein LOC122434225 [Cervus canadensis]